MSWDPGYHSPEVPKEDINSDWKFVKGDLSFDEARDWFTMWMACNPFFAAKLIIGPHQGTLAPIQEIIVKTWFLRKRNMLIAGRGFSKSYTAAIFIVLYAIFNPGAKIGIFSASFRQAKMIFQQIEKFNDDPDAHILRGCIKGRIKHETDNYEMMIGTTSVKCLPLTQKSRGLRINLLIVDEYLLMPEKIIEEIIGPMLSVLRTTRYNYEENQKGEDLMVKKGQLKEWHKFKKPENKTIMLSSATYEMSTLYQTVYKKMLGDIRDPNAEKVDYSVLRLSWECAPKHLDHSEIEEQKTRMSRAQFDREYNAIFTKETGGFYSMLHIEAATVPFEEEPKMKLVGDPDKEYLIAIDPNHQSGSETADNFSIAVIELNNDGSERGFLVHAYAMAMSDFSKRTLYLRYLLDHFNVRLIIADNSGGPRYIEEFNGLQSDYKVKLSQALVDFDTEEGFRATRNNYNPTSGAMVFYQVFNIRNWIRDANEALTGDIQAKRMMFAARISCDDIERTRYSLMNLPEIDQLEFKDMDDSIKGEMKKMEFLDHVDDRIENTRRELALIEHKIDAGGNHKFDLPRELKNTTAKNKIRRDSYTALLLGNWGRRMYFRLNNAPVETGDFYMGEGFF